MGSSRVKQNKLRNSSFEELCSMQMRIIIYMLPKINTINAASLGMKLHITWWRHQIETFSTLLALGKGNSPVTCDFPSQRQVKRYFDVFFDLPWTNGWVNNRYAGDKRRHCAHFGVTVMTTKVRRSPQVYKGMLLFVWCMCDEWVWKQPRFSCRPSGAWQTATGKNDCI